MKEIKDIKITIDSIICSTQFGQQLIDLKQKPYLCFVARILGIDYGTKRIGIATSDPLQIIATGLDTVATDKIFDYLENYISVEAVESIVVGEPRHFDGNPTHITHLVIGFVRKLRKLFPNIEVVTRDERFTSVDAKAIILKSGAKKKKRRNKGLVDKISAVLILQEYMEERRS